MENCDSNSSLSDGEESWDEFGEEEGDAVCCLFCEHKFRNPAEVFQHCKAVHEFDVQKLKTLWNLDTFSYIRLINFIRNLKPSSKEVLENHNIVNLISTGDDLMKPVVQDDPLLMFDLDDLEDNNSETFPQNPKGFKYSVAASAEIQILKLQLGAAEQQNEKLKDVLKAVIGVDTNTNHPTKKANVNEEEDSYFSSYSHFSIHLEMLQDEERTNCYRQALDDRGTIEGKTVLDVGCGTGILSMFAAKTGAKLVIGVDHSEIIYRAMDIVRENGFDKVIVLLKGRMEDAQLPVTEVDVIVSEWMGYFLLFECMLDTVVWARDHYLKPGGAILPRTCSLSIAAIHDTEKYKKSISYWDDVYGFTMRCMKSEVIKEASVELVDKDTVISNSYTLKTFDMLTCSNSDVQFSEKFHLTLAQDKPLTAFVGYFNCIFPSTNGEQLNLDTSPFAPPTHWKQTVFHLPEPLSISGNHLEGNFSCHRIPKDPRSLKVTIHLLGRHFTYFLQ